METKTIIAATDFSDKAKHALEYAADLASDIHAKLLIINTVSVQPVFSDDPSALTFVDKIVDTSKEELENLKEEIVRRTKGKLSIETIEDVGFINKELKNLSHKKDIFAVVIASHAATNIEKILTGTHAVKIAKDNHAPVIVVPENAGFASLKKIAIAIDLRENNVFPYDILKRQLQLFRAETDIVFITNNDDLSVNNLPGSAEAKSNLQEFKPKFCLVKNKNIKDGLEEYVRLHEPDLLILFSKRHGLFEKSESTYFIEHPAVPVMILSPSTR